MADEPKPLAPHNSASDRGFFCRVALRLSDFWDFIDHRQIDVHLVCWAFFTLTGYVVYWATEYVWMHPDKPGLEVAAICGAITVPLTWIMPKIVDAYFAARK